MPKPCEIFDLIGGTSTGGLIAILLGRLELSVQQAIDEYRVLSKVIFGPKKAFWKDGKFKASRLERAVEGIVRKYGGDQEGVMGLKGEGRCKVLVLFLSLSFLVLLCRLPACACARVCLVLSIHG